MVESLTFYFVNEYGGVSWGAVCSHGGTHDLLENISWYWNLLLIMIMSRNDCMVHGRGDFLEGVLYCF